MTGSNEKHGGEDHRNAVCPGDEKLDPGEVPVCEFTGLISAPQTDGKLLIAFETEGGNTVAVRLDDDEKEELMMNMESMEALAE